MKSSFLKISTFYHWGSNFRSPPKFSPPPLDTKAPGPPIIYQVGPLAISDPQCFPQVGGSKFDKGGLSQKMGGAWGQLKMSKNTCEEVQLIVKWPAISLQASKFTKNELLHTYFSRTLTRF